MRCSCSCKRRCAVQIEQATSVAAKTLLAVMPGFFAVLARIRTAQSLNFQSPSSLLSESLFFTSYIVCHCGFRTVYRGGNLLVAHFCWRFRENSINLSFFKHAKVTSMAHVARSPDALETITTTTSIVRFIVSHDRDSVVKCISLYFVFTCIVPKFCRVPKLHLIKFPICGRWL